jgi:hypothetical protein
MDQVKSDPLVASMHGLRQALAADSRDRDSWWAEAVHIALGQVAAAIQEEVQLSDDYSPILPGRPSDGAFP